MGDKPILFSAPMVRALLAGTKTQTRRMLDLACDDPPAFVEKGVITAFDENEKSYRWPRTKAVGDRLYVREAWSFAADHCWTIQDMQMARFHRKIDLYYRADPTEQHGHTDRWFSSIHMPRWVSRLTLTVTEVRVQRLHECSAADAREEGIYSLAESAICDSPSCGDDPARICSNGECDASIRTYAHLWDSINGEGAWDKNPWVAAYSFTVQRGNIDQVAP